MSSLDPAAVATSSTEVVAVVLSTFNGSEFLQQQLDSLYAQSYPYVRILVRDDGSTDSTRRILEREQAGGRLELLAGHDNVGAANSFFELLKHAASVAHGYVAFCDQDDVWLPEKLARAVSRLSDTRNQRPALYCSRLEVVDAGLTHVGYTAEPRKVGFGNALVENIAVGCTVVLNRPAIDLLCQQLPPKVPVHDWWCYLAVSCFGEIVFDREAMIKYRQHGKNTFGVAQGQAERVSRNLRRFGSNGEGRHWQSDQAAVFLATFGEAMPASRRQLLQRFVEGRSVWWRRLQLALSKDTWRQKRIDGLAWRCLVLVNRY